MQPRGPYDLATQSTYFGGWPHLAAEPSTIVQCFPVDGEDASAAVAMRQAEDGSISLRFAGGGDAAVATAQALSTVSLDVDGSGWPAVGERDGVIGALQQRYGMLRPVLFSSPYEAAVQFVLSHRRSIVQARRHREMLAATLGDAVTLEGETFHALPRPQRLLEVAEIPGVDAIRSERLRAIAAAAVAGWLRRDVLRAMDEAAALAKLRTLPGIGDFFAQGILYRGAGCADGMTLDDMTLHAVRSATALGEAATADDVVERAEQWRPYRMWAAVLLHVDMRRSGKLPLRRGRAAPTRRT